MSKLRIVLVVLLVTLTVGCDQATKLAARSSLAGQGTVFVVDNVLILRYVENRGAFLSLGAGLPDAVRTAALIALPVLICAAALIYLARARAPTWATIVGVSLIAGGGFGNLIDRVFRHGRVSDFINLGIGAFRTGIFNVADLSVLCGCVVLLLWHPAGRAPSPGAPGD